MHFIILSITFERVELGQSYHLSFALGSFHTSNTAIGQIVGTYRVKRCFVYTSH